MKTIYKITLFCVLIFSANVIFAQQAETEKGVEFYEKGEYQKAVETLQKSVEADKNSQKAWLYLGMSYARLKDRSKATKAFKNADKISDKNVVPDTTVTPVKIISKPRASYTDAARQNQTQGTIKIAVEFGADGKIKGYYTFQALPYGLTENTLKVLEQVRFEPATKDGKAISTVKILSYTFTIY